MPSVLIVYYSLTGNTRAAAETLRDALGADLVEIRDKRPRRGIRGAFRSIWETLRSATPDIETDAHHPLAYQLAVLATPVWAARPASPMHAYVETRGATLPKVAFLCTLGGSGAAATFERLSRIAGKTSVARLALSDADRRSGADKGALVRFAKEIRGATTDADTLEPLGSTQTVSESNPT